MRRAAIDALAIIAALFVACEPGGRGSPPPWSEAALGAGAFAVRNW